MICERKLNCGLKSPKLAVTLTQHCALNRVDDVINCICTTIYIIVMWCYNIFEKNIL